VTPQENPQQQRNLVLFLLVALGLSFVYTSFFAPPPPPPGAADAGAQLEADAGVVTPPPGQAPSQVAVEAPSEIPERSIELKRPEVVYTVTSNGGGLSSAVLTGEKMREQMRVGFVEGWKRWFGAPRTPAPQMNLAMPPPGGPVPLAVSIEGDAPLPHATRYLIEELEDGQGVSMRANASGWQVEKRLRYVPEGFEFAYEVTVTNTSDSARQGELAFSWARQIDPEFEEAPSMLGGVGNQSRASCHVADDQEILLPGKEDAPVQFTGPIRYFGIDQQYFTSQLFFMEGARQGSCELEATSTLRRVKAKFPLQLGPGASATFKMGGFAGPKDGDLLEVAPSPSTAALEGLDPKQTPRAGLDGLVDFGFLVVICKLLLAVLKASYAVLGNWGLAIIALTFFVKMVLLPLTYKQLVSAEEMKKLQPKMEAIRKKYADDKEKQQLETLKLYQEAKMNPLSGCLPMLLQMPVFFALFTTLRNSFDIYGEPFFGPVWTDLTFKDPTYVLPVLLGVTMIVTQRLQPQMMDAAQARIMNWVMPIMFTGFMLGYPAGLSLYFFTNNVMSIAQTYGIRKWLEHKKAKAA